MNQTYNDSIMATADIIAISRNTLTAALEFFNQDDTPFDFSDKLVVIKFFFNDKKTACILTEPLDYIIDGNTITFNYLISLAKGCSFNYEIIMEDAEDIVKTLLTGKIIVQ